uniref:Uncharacterized protein n=1 Tax=Romanomermis culicivorax TaxID=13658 RepID=A0A915JZV2_ROMCU
FSGFSRSFCLYLQAAIFRKQLNRGVIIIFASKHDVHFCIINESSDRRTRRNRIIDSPRSPIPLLAVWTVPNWINSVQTEKIIFCIWFRILWLSFERSALQSCSLVQSKKKRMDNNLTPLACFNFPIWQHWWAAGSDKPPCLAIFSFITPWINVAIISAT